MCIYVLLVSHVCVLFMYLLLYICKLCVSMYVCAHVYIMHLSRYRRLEDGKPQSTAIDSIICTDLRYGRSGLRVDCDHRVRWPVG